MIEVSAPSSNRPTRLIVEYKSGITPRIAADAANQLKSYLSQLAGAAAVVAAPWEADAPREVLKNSRIGFIDPTGNIDLVLDEPGIVIRVRGADENPQGKRSASPNLRGPKAWALMKTIIEVKPPYGVRELAAAVDTDPG